MTESGKDRAASEPRDIPGWEESLSLKIKDTAQRAAALTEEWNGQFGAEAFQNPHFVKAYLSLTRGKSILVVFKNVHARDRVEEELSDSSFESRFEQTAEAVMQAVPVPDPVALSFFHYLGLLLEEARTQKGEELLAYPEPLQQILTFGRQLMDHPALGGFRIDVQEHGALPPGDAGSPELPELPKGYHLGKVDIVRRIAVGGFAQVYQVYHPGLKEHRAAKLFMKHNLLGELGQLLKAFYAEAQLQNTLKHPNIVRVLDVDDHLGYLVLFMEYVDGHNLRSLIEETKSAQTHFRPSDILEIVIPVAKGLEYAHAHQIMHRDLKPENILIAQDGGVKITDFGLAKTLNATGQRRTTRLGNLVGTAHYMAPEQIFGEVYDLRVDLYALGAVIYHMAEGAPPFNDKDIWKVLDLQRSRKPAPLTEVVDGFPEELNRIVMKLLEKRPDNRYSSATELIKDLESCQAGLSIAGPRVGGRRRRVGTVMAIVALFLVAAVAGYFGLQGWNPKTDVSEKNTLTLARKEDHESGAPNEALSPAPADFPKAKEAERDPIEASIREPEAKPQPPVASKPSPSRETPSLQKQLLASPPTKEDTLFIGRMLDLFSKHRSQLLARSYEDLAKSLETLGQTTPKKSDLMSLEISAAGDLVRLARELVEARFQALARSKGEIHLTLADGSVTGGVVDHVSAGAITLAGAGGGKTNVEFLQLAAEEFLGGKTAPLAELAFQALSGDAGKALTGAIALEKEQERIVLWYPVLVRLARLEIQDRVRAALLEALEPLAKGDRLEELPAGLARYPQASIALKSFERSEPKITPVFGLLGSEFDRARDEHEAMGLFFRGQYSKVLTGHPGTQAHPLAAKLLLAGFLLDFEEPDKKEAPKKTDELISSGGWSKYEWKLHPDEKTYAERQQFWKLDPEKEGSILLDPAGPRSLIMHVPHPRPSEGLILRTEFEPLGDAGLEAQWRLLLLSEDGHNNYLRFDVRTLALDRTFKAETKSSEGPLATANLPPLGAGQTARTTVLIRGEEGFHVYVDGELAATLPKKECVLPGQLQVVVIKGKLYLKSILAKKDGK